MLLEANDEWQLQHRYMQTEAITDDRGRIHPNFRHIDGVRSEKLTRTCE